MATTAAGKGARAAIPSAAEASATRRAERKQSEAIETAAQSLRANLHTKAMTMEPSLKLLRRALACLFVSACG